MTDSPAITGADLEQARRANADAHDRVTAALERHLAALVRAAFPTADGITVCFPRLESEGEWAATLAGVWTWHDAPEGEDKPGYEVHLFDESALRPDRQAGREKLLTEIEHLVTELAEDSEVGDWESEDQVGIRRWCTLAALVGD